MERIRAWLRGQRNEKELKEFIERTTSTCFIRCIKSVSRSVSKKEEDCLERCAKQQLEMLKQIEESVIQNLNGSNK